jgi:hypothetical protein
LAAHDGAVEVSLEALRQLPPGLRFNLTVTDDAAYRIEVTDEDGQSYRLPDDPEPIDGREATADGLNAWAGFPAESVRP